ncbi:MAG: membrane protein insertase YidC [Candidatus Levybacteria bacterium]|nr:membrane protein insertase YidC [Candidatus Levybacteria bacterium]
MGELFNVILVAPIVNILVAVYQVLSFLHIPYALGFSIILLTVLIRLILYPFTAVQLKASKKMQELNPHLSKIKDKHKGDSTRIQQETMRLYKEHGVNPAAGCLPMLIQLPIIWALYTVLQRVVEFKGNAVVSEINKLTYQTSFLKLSQPWDTSFFGLPLGQSPAQLITALGTLVFILPLLTGIFQLIQSKMMFSKPVDQQDVKNEKTPKKQDDFASAMQTQSLYIFPVMIGFFSFSFPIGISLYWNTFTIFGILQQYQIQGLGGLSEWTEKIKKFGK